MFAELFDDPNTVQKYEDAPLAEQRSLYLRHLAEFGAKKGVLRENASNQLHLICLLDLTEPEQVNISAVEAATWEWSRPRAPGHGRTLPASARSAGAFFQRAVRWLRFLGWLEEPASAQHPYTAEVTAYEAWLRHERGLSKETIDGYCTSADQFLHWLAASEIPLASLAITAIDRAITEKKASGQYSRTTMRIYAVRIRQFFRFAERQGWCMPGLAAAIIPPLIYPDRKVPTRLTRPDIERLLATTEGDRPADKRDRAILMLLIAYGLRSGELRGLQLDDLDWENETLQVRRPKPGRTHLYPLSRAVGQAILCYLQDVRRSDRERTLFLTLNSPIKPLSRGGLSNIVYRRLRRLGIVNGRRGPHTLRHTAAQHLLDQGMSMKVIGDFLGHRDPSSTATYAKVNLNALRQVGDFDLGALV